MKTLVINGSPRKNGDSITLVNEMRKFIEGEVKIVNTYYDNISGCIDCRYCWINSGCAINDGMQEIYKFLDYADNIIISSPIYFSELTGSLLNFASRLQTLYATKRKRKDNEFSLKKKNGVLIISAGGDSINLQGRTIETANIIFNHMNAKPIGTVYTFQTDDIPAKENINALNKAREFALELNRLHIGSDI